MRITNRVEEFLAENGVDFEVIEHPPACTAQEEAAASHVPGRSWAKTVVVMLDGGPALAVLPAPLRVDLERLADLASSERAELAEEEHLRALYPDCAVGAMPPFGNLYGQSTFLEKSLREDATIAFHAGDHETALELSYRAFEELVEPVEGAFAERVPA